MSDGAVKILLIEDNPGDVRLIREILKEAQSQAFMLEWSETLRDGLLKLTEAGADVVLTDLGLSDSEGLDTYHKLHAQFPEMPIIVLTGFDDESLAVKAVRNGAQDYLVKGQIDGRLLSRSVLYAVERKKSENTMKKLQHQNELILNSAGEGIFGLDLKGDITFINPIGAAMLNYEVEELTGKNGHWTFHQFKPDGSKYPEEECPICRAYKDGIIHREENEIYWRKDGSGFPIRYISTPIIEGNTIKGAVVSFIDITKRKKADMALRKAYDELIEEIARRKKAEEDLIANQQQLRNLYLNLQFMMEEERSNIAREIHDELGQIMTAIKMDLAWVNKKYSDNEQLFEKTLSMLRLTDATIKSIKKICTELRPGILDHLGLGAAIKWQAQEFQNRTEIECTLVVEDIDVDRERSTALFRIFQEALTNVFRHANATRITVNMNEENGRIILRVSDNGKGFSEAAKAKPNSFGLLGMRERLYPWKGTLNIKSSLNNGTTIEAILPG